MIQRPIMNLLKSNIPGLIWSIDNRTASDNTGTVYQTGGSKPDIYEADMRYPYYQIFIRSSDFVKVENAAQKVYDLLHQKTNWTVEIPIYEKMTDTTPKSVEQIHVFFIEALSEPLRLGVNGNIMEYSINVQATVRK
ncbi:minor capsid protein [Macrococcus brunensis]|uniref:minor capsid protein n=1 Tax=Macrococcus brunensis TaxID=198483 RepID=UPI001EF09F80|nr:minor capsid protein [Macrococcus brunensis]ULG70878.1 minor capsid protein [Macrococcus brunensis]